MTSEPSRDIEKIDAFADQYEVPWPIGYEADETVRALGVRGIPATFVIGRDGRVAWTSRQSGSLSDAIERALATSDDNL